LTTVLTAKPGLVGLKFRLWNYPTMSVKWRDTKADYDVVILIPKLLELVEATLPQCGELDFSVMVMNESVRI